MKRPLDSWVQTAKGVEKLANLIRLIQFRNIMQTPLAFISYRRNDALAAARGLMRFLQANYGNQAVFMDTAEIRIGDDWKEKIENALSRSTVIIPIIGRHWIRLTDDFGQRRIDKDTDWVRREIHYALQSKKTILPIYVGTQSLPTEAFPEPLKPISAIQAMIVQGEDFEWKRLGTHLQRFGFNALIDEVRYPRATVNLEPLNDEAIHAALKFLPGWRRVASPVPGLEHVTRSEIHACFEFRTFDAAIQFIAEVSPEISRAQHHPRWENIWRTVNIYLTTWDLQFQVSALDITLAEYLTIHARRLGAEIR